MFLCVVNVFVCSTITSKRVAVLFTQVALGISAADDAAASHALNAVEQSLSLLQGKKNCSISSTHLIHTWISYVFTWLKMVLESVGPYLCVL